MERPNTVSGLEAKREELLRFRNGLEGELRKVICDIDHLDACIRLFDPTDTSVVINRYVTKHRAQKGQMRRFVLSYLRQATGPVTSREITEAWMEARGLRTDEQTFVILRKRAGACLTKLRVDGVIAGADHIGDYKGWVLVRTERLAAPNPQYRIGRG